jgi:hypothetical protein
MCAKKFGTIIVDFSNFPITSETFAMIQKINTETSLCCQSSLSFSAPLHKVEGRAIYYHIADDKGDVDEDDETRSFTFNGSNLEELTHKLQEETGLHDIIICTRSPITGKLAPLRLQLPPNNAAMHIVLVQESSKGEFCHSLLFSPS